jgi:hypothetical protein
LDRLDHPLIPPDRQKTVPGASWLQEMAFYWQA